MTNLSTEENFSKRDSAETIQPIIISIVGGGFSGSMVLYHLLKNKHLLPLNSQIKVIDDKNQFNKGIAYSTKSEAHILNVPAGNMGATPDNPAGFLEWLKLNGYSVEAGDFVQRYLYAEYLQSIINTELKGVNFYHQVDFIHDTVTDISNIGDNKIKITLKSGNIIKSNKLVIAAGNFPQFIPEGLKSIRSSKRYISNPWEFELPKDQLPKYKDILVVGTSLTAIDVVLDLESKGFKGNFTMLSRHGYLPLSHPDTHEPLPKIEIANETFNSVNSSLKWLREYSKIHGWVPIFETIRPQLQSFWLSWSERERNRFKRVVKPLWEIHRHRIPTSSHNAIQDLINSGRLKIISGKILNCIESVSKITTKVKLRGECDKIQSINTDLVFNCTGLKDSLDQNNESLRSSLLEIGAIYDDITFGAQAKVDNNFNVIIDSKPINNIFILGALLRSQFGESTAVRELRVQAQKVANSLASALADN